MAVTTNNLPTPEIIEALDYQTIFDELRADFQSKFPSFSALVESDPAMKLLEVAAYRETILRGRVNDAFKATLLGLAAANDLDNLADFYNVSRASAETDDELRARTIEKIKGSSTAGGASWYRFQALSADARLSDALVTSPAPGDVLVALLSEESALIKAATGAALDTLGATYGVTRDGTTETDAVYRPRVRTAALGSAGDGAASSVLISAVDATLQSPDVRVITDSVSTVSAQIVVIDVSANIYLYPQTNPSILSNLEENLRADLSAAGGLGWDLARSWLISRMHLEGVQRVELTSPASDVVISGSQAVAFGSVTITLAGYDR